MEKIINCNGYDFKMIMTKEEEGYFSTDRVYDLFYKDNLIAKDLKSIKSCYNEAYNWLERISK